MVEVVRELQGYSLLVRRRGGSQAERYAVHRCHGHAYELAEGPTPAIPTHRDRWEIGHRVEVALALHAESFVEGQSKTSEVLHGLSLHR